MMRSLAVLFAVFTLAACATPAIQPPQTPPLGFAGPALEARTLLMDDGARLPLARWTPDAGEPWAVIVALHGMNDSRASFRLAAPGGPSGASRPGRSTSAVSARLRAAASGPGRRG